MAGGHTLNLKQGPGPRSRRHPERIRPGQLFFPLAGARRVRLEVTALDGEWVRVKREDGSQARVALDNLLELGADRRGARYRFHGWRPRPRGYRTELRVLRVSTASGRCVVMLDEWDPRTEIELDLRELPEAMRVPGSTGSCMANLSSTSTAGLAIHNCRRKPVRDASRTASASHPESLLGGQRFRRRSDGASFRILECSAGRVRAWNGRRVVSLSFERLLAVRRDGQGRDYEFLGGGVRARRRAAR